MRATHPAAIEMMAEISAEEMRILRDGPAKMKATMQAEEVRIESLLALTANFSADWLPIVTTVTTYELDRFLAQKPASGTPTPIGDTFIDWCADGKPLLMFGILRNMSQWLGNQDSALNELYVLNKLIHNKGFDLMGTRVYSDPNEEEGNLINQHQNEGELPRLLAPSHFEGGRREFRLTPRLSSDRRIQILSGAGCQADQKDGLYYSTCAVFKYESPNMRRGGRRDYTRNI